MVASRGWTQPVATDGEDQLIANLGAYGGGEAHGTESAELIQRLLGGPTSVLTDIAVRWRRGGGGRSRPSGAGFESLVGVHLPSGADLLPPGATRRWFIGFAGRSCLDETR
jgi:hypothetical protein